MMTIKEYAENVAQLLQEKLEGTEVEVSEVLKMNDQKFYGLSIREGDDPAPTFYINNAFEYCDPVEKVAEDIADAYTVSVKEGPQPTQAPDLTFDNVKDAAGIRLAGKAYNEEYLKTVPYKDVGFGYVLLADISIGADDGGVFSTVVTNAIADDYGYDMEELFDLALENAKESNPADMVKMEDALGSFAEPDEQGPGIHILTTARQRFGACALFYPGMQEMLAEELGEGFYAIPSSCHEFLILPESKIPDPQKLAEMVAEANKVIVSREDLLSENVLHYSEGRLGMVEKEALPLSHKVTAAMGGACYVS